MTEKKVPYQVNGRPFEGVIVCDDSVKGKRPAIFMQPDWKGVCADTIGQARTAAGKDYVVLMADMFGTGYGDKPKTQQELRSGMLAVHDDLAFTIACGGGCADKICWHVCFVGTKKFPGRIDPQFINVIRSATSNNQSASN